MCGIQYIKAIIDRTRGCFNPETAPTANGRQESSILFIRTDPKGRREGGTMENEKQQYYVEFLDPKESFHSICL